MLQLPPKQQQQIPQMQQQQPQMPLQPGGQQQSLQMQQQQQQPFSPSGGSCVMNFQTKKGRFHNWSILHRQNKKLDNENLLKGYDMRRESRSYLITLKGCQGIPLQEISSSQGQLPMQSAKYSLEYYATLYNREMGTHGGFYGRTYRSKALQLRESAGTWDCKEDDLIYFHTNYIEKSSYIVVECVLVRDIAGTKTYSSAGFVLCELNIGQASLVELTKGSPRSIGILGMEAVSRGQKSSGRLEYEIRDYPQYDKMKQLIPQNCFIGLEDTIPGLLNDKLPPPRAAVGKAIDLQLLPRATLYIHHIQMLTSIAFETRFENFLRRMKQEKLKNAKTGNSAVTDNVYIEERRILVYANNTWRNVTDEAYVSMGAPNEQGISQSNGMIALKNIILHPLVALIFRVEYKAVLPIAQRNEQLFFTLGWTCHLPAFNAAGELSDEAIDVKFTLGPGSTPNGDLLWDPNADDTQFYQVRMKAFISTSASPPIGTATGYEGMMKTPAARNPNMMMMNQPMAADPQVTKMMTAKDQQIRELEMKMQEIQRREQSLSKHAETLEMKSLQQQNQNNPYAANMAYGNRGGIDPQVQMQMKQLQQEKAMIENQYKQMQNDMKNVFESFNEVRQQQQQQIMMQQQQSMYGRQPSGMMMMPGQQMQYNQQQMYVGQQIDAPLSAQSSAHIASIANVFYNMLNMLGEKEQDRRFIGLSEEMKRQMQTSRHDDLLAPKVPYVVGIKQVNLLKTTDLPLSDQVNFIKHGLGDALKHPSAAIKSDGIQKSKIGLELEAQDPLKASTITFKFICYKTPWGGIDTVPKKFFFHFKFFTFPAVKTAVVQIKNPNEHATTSEDLGLKAGQPYYLSRMYPQSISKKTLVDQETRNKSTLQGQQEDTMHDPNLLAVTFTIDPSISHIADEHMRLADYLYDRFLTVDVFDADSLFLYGTCKLPMFELLRQSRGSVVRAKECEMCDADSGEFRGAIQLIMTNAGSTPSVQLVDSTNANPSMNAELSLKDKSGKGKVQPSQGANHDSSKCKKVVKSKPMDLTQMQNTNNPANSITAGVNYAAQTLLSQMSEDEISNVSQNNADLRKKLRVDRVRKMTMGGGGKTSTGMAISTMASVEDPTQPDWLKLKSLREIEMIRATKKEQILTRVMEDYVSGAQQLAVLPGQLQFVTVKIHNAFTQAELYRVHINDPDEKFMQEREMQLVVDKAEWRYWVTQGKCARPNNYDVMTNQGDIFLQPDETIEILFKFITLRDVSPIADYATQNPQCFIRQRKLQIIVMQQNKQPYSNTEVNIVPASAPIDHTFRFYEPQNSHVTLTIPPFLSLDYMGLHAVLSKPTAAVEIDRRTGCMKIQSKTEEENTVTEMTLFVYSDQYREKLLATCSIEVYSMVTLYTKIKAGLQSLQSLAIPSETARSVMIHSSNPKLVYLPKRETNRAFRLIPQTINHVQVSAKTYLPIQQRVKIHCTDVNSGELVYSWLLVIDSEQPNITKTHEILVKKNHVSVQSMEFVSRLNVRAVFEFASSDDNLVVPKNRALAFEPRECKMIDLHFPALSQTGAHLALVFANDLDHNIVECYQLRILCYE